MTDNQNKFYTSISKYYSDIFPFKPAQLQFVQSQLENIYQKKILDIGCATGELAYQLAKKGAGVAGIDLNPDLIARANNTHIHSDLQFRVGDMLRISNEFQPKSFDTALCFGNTLVHLLSVERIQKMLEGVHQVLKPGGKFLLQILNYDYILEKKVTELPLIETENIRFIREYKIDESNPIIRFQTELVMKKERKSVRNVTPLLALRSEELKNLLTQSGFRNIELFANFKEEPFGGDHLPLVVRCMKG